MVPCLHNLLSLKWRKISGPFPFESFTTADATKVAWRVWKYHVAVVTADQGSGCFIPDELPWQYHAMLLVKYSLKNNNSTKPFVDKKLLSISTEVQLLQTHLWATYLVPWLIRRPGPGSLYCGSLRG